MSTTETDPTERFWLGEDSVLEDRHVGEVIYVDHLQRGPVTIGGDVRWSSTSYAGVLTGFIEHRGEMNLAAGDTPDDFASFPDYHVTVFLAGMQPVRVDEMDRARIHIFHNHNHIPGKDNQ